MILVVSGPAMHHVPKRSPSIPIQSLPRRPLPAVCLSVITTSPTSESSGSSSMVDFVSLIRFGLNLHGCHIQTAARRSPPLECPSILREHHPLLSA